MMTMALSGCSRSEPRPLISFPTPSWAKDGELSLRVSEGELLLRHNGSPVLYAYDRGARLLREVSSERWSAAEGATIECASAGRPASKDWRIDPQAGLLRGGTPQRLAGARPLLVRLSPSARWLSALSATAGGDSLLPALGGAPVHGPLLHEVLFAADGQSAGPSARLAAELERTLVLACWSPDERDIVYHDRLFTRLSVASFVPPKKEHS
jgi:hypothetical protein